MDLIKESNAKREEVNETSLNPFSIESNSSKKNVVKDINKEKLIKNNDKALKNTFHEKYNDVYSNSITSNNTRRKMTHCDELDYCILNYDLNHAIANSNNNNNINANKMQVLLPYCKPKASNLRLRSTYKSLDNKCHRNTSFSNKRDIHIMNININNCNSCVPNSNLIQSCKQNFHNSKYSSKISLSKIGGEVNDLTITPNADLMTSMTGNEGTYRNSLFTEKPKELLSKGQIKTRSNFNNCSSLININNIKPIKIDSTKSKKKSKEIERLDNSVEEPNNTSMMYLNKEKAIKLSNFDNEDTLRLEENKEDELRKSTNINNASDKEAILKPIFLGSFNLSNNKSFDNQNAVYQDDCNNRVRNGLKSVKTKKSIKSEKSSHSDNAEFKSNKSVKNEVLRPFKISLNKENKEVDPNQEDQNNNPACRICLEETYTKSSISINNGISIGASEDSHLHFIHEKNSKLIIPCKCAGSIKYVHHGCLKTWVKSHYNTNLLEAKCEICKEYFLLSRPTIYSEKKAKKDKISAIKSLILLLLILLMVDASAIVILKHTVGLKVSSGSGPFWSILAVNIIAISIFGISTYKNSKKYGKVKDKNSFEVLDISSPRYKSKKQKGMFLNDSFYFDQLSDL